MAKLSGKQRNSLPSADFAEPGERKYPVNDKSHAKNALARVSQHGTPEEKAEVRAKVHRKYPSIGKKAGHKTRVRARTSGRKRTARKKA